MKILNCVILATTLALLAVSAAAEDQVVGGDDFIILRDCINQPGEGAREGCKHADFNGDNKVNATDFEMFQDFFGGSPGPSGLHGEIVDCDTL